MFKLYKLQILIVALLGSIAVILGAFSAHGLTGKISVEQMQTFETAVKYHFYHCLAALLTVVLGKAFKIDTSVSVWLFIAGILLFSGSLYILAIQDLIGVSFSTLGIVTPIGGFGFILGWVTLFISVYKKK